VSVQARIGATAPALGGLAWGLLAGGAFLTIVGVLLIVLAARRRAARPPAGAPFALPQPGGPPTGWVPAPREGPDPAVTRDPAGPGAAGQPRSGG
jgi:hypothetical protein